MFSAAVFAASLSASLSGFSFAKSTFTALPMISLPSISFCAVAASSGLTNSTKPKPLLLLVSGSSFTLAKATSPNLENSSLRSFHLNFRFSPPTKSFVWLMMVFSSDMYPNKQKNKNWQIHMYGTPIQIQGFSYRFGEYPRPSKICKIRESGYNYSDFYTIIPLWWW